MKRREDIRQHILEAARDLFLHHGYAAVSMRKIAEKIEYSPTTIYLYFRDKSELFDCLHRETVSELVDRAAAAARTGSRPNERLSAWLRAYIDFGVLYPDRYALAFQAADTKPRPASTSDAGRVLASITPVLTDCIGLSATEVSVRHAAYAAWASIHGAVSLLNAAGVVPPDERLPLVESTVETVLAGLGGCKQAEASQFGEAV